MEKKLCGQEMRSVISLCLIQEFQLKKITTLGFGFAYKKRSVNNKILINTIAAAKWQNYGAKNVPLLASINFIVSGRKMSGRNVGEIYMSQNL